MNDSIDVAIPAAKVHSESAEDFRLYFKAMLQDVSGDFSKALDLGCDHRKFNAILERVTIESVSVESDRIVIAYHVELSVFNACNLQTDSYSFHRTVFGLQVGNCWRFSKFTPLPERSSADEF